jgi:lipoprotein-releasing system ATP-binding protein
VTVSQVDISVESVTFRYPAANEPQVVDLTERFIGGRLHGISGRSGSGKSTLLFLVGLLLRPQSGVIRFNEASVSTLSDRAASLLRSRAIGFLFQDANLDPRRSLLENVLEPTIYSGGRELRHRAIELLERFAPDVSIMRGPLQISGGQAQRVALCRALVNAPSILLADEPTGNLDSENRMIVLAALGEHARSGANVLIASHDPLVLSTCADVLNVGREMPDRCR